MNSGVTARIERVMRERGCSFGEAAAWLGQRGAAKRAERRRGKAAEVVEAERLTAVRRGWAWKGDFQ